MSEGDVEVSKHIEIITHFEKSDVSHCGEYSDIEVFVNGELAAKFGDYYHDKGSAKANGFVVAAKYFLGENNVFITEESVADRDY